MKKNFKKLLLITALLVAVGMMLGASSVAMAKTKKLKTKTIPAGRSVNLKVKGKANWAISNAAVARMTVVSQNVAQVTGLKKGKTNITAAVGNTKYKATIKVKASKKGAAGTSNVVQSLSSAPIDGSADSIYYLSTGATVVGHFDYAFANDIIGRTNTYRGSSGVGTLGADAILSEAAKTRAAEAAVVFSHTRPNGTQYYTVAGTEESNYQDSPVFGENLAYGYNNASETMDAWIASTGHQANLVRGSFTKIGVAVLWVKQANGSYVAYIGQEFG